MPGFPRDLADPDFWEDSLARSRERRSRASNRPVPRHSRLSELLDARRPLPTRRDLSDAEPWDLSLLRSRTRRRASELQFVPTATRARRVSLGTLIAIAAGPAAGLADASGRTSASALQVAEPPTTATHSILLRDGSNGRQVRMLQQALGVVMDGIYGPETEAAVRSYQASRGLIVDGIVGPETSGALARNAPPLARLTDQPSTADRPTTDSGAATSDRRPAADPSVSSAPDPVVRLQEALGVQVDGTFGPETEAAVRRLQAHDGLTVDGVVGPQTWSALHVDEHAVLRAIKPRQTERDTTMHASASAPPAHRRSHASASEGSSGGNPVRRLQEALHVQVDGTFGPETEAAVRRLQAHDGLTVDGVVGPQTWSALGLKEGVTLHPPQAPTPTPSSGAGESSSAGGGSSVVARVIAAANEIATRPYVYGGGHGSFQSTGYDCSGSVSYALHGGGLLSSPEDSSELESYGDPGPGRYITIYADAEHAWMVVDGRRFDTIAQQESGTRWSDSMMSTAGYVVRHPAGL
jgi:peptidoglycan hydrolase-like protein with peptidoglycan-binding domain